MGISNINEPDVVTLASVNDVLVENIFDINGIGAEFVLLPIRTARGGFGSGVTTNHTTTATYTCQEGNHLIVAIHITGSQFVRLTWNGQTFQCDYTNSAMSIWRLRATKTATAPISYTTDTASPRFFVTEVKNISIRQYDQAAYATGTSADPDSGLTAITTQDEELWLGVVKTDGADTDIPGTWQNGYTAGQVYGTSAGSIGAIWEGYKIVSSIGQARTQILGMTSPGLVARTWHALALTYKAADTASETYTGSIISDGFDDDVMNPDVWAQTAFFEPNQRSTVRESGGVVRMDAAAENLNNIFNGYQSVEGYDVTGKHMHIEVPLVTNSGTSTTSTRFGFYADEGNNVQFMKVNTNLTMRVATLGVSSDTSIAYDSTAHRWWRIEQSGSDFLFQTSPDGVAWTTRRTAAAPTFPYTNMRVGFLVGTTNGHGGAGAGSAEFDNFSSDLVGNGGELVTLAQKGAGVTDTATPVSVTYPASVQAGQLLLMVFGMKPTSTGAGSVTTPTGWTALGSLLGSGVGAPGDGTGDTNIFAFYKIADGSETGNLSVSYADNQAIWANMLKFQKSGEAWHIAIATGQQVVSGNVNIAFDSDPGVQAGDYVVVAKVSPTDVNTATAYSAGTLTQTGVTFGTVLQHTDNSSLDVATNNRIGGTVQGAYVLSGTSSSVPTFTSTVNGADHGYGSALFIRVRSGDPTPAITREGFNTGVISATTTISPLYPPAVESGDLLVMWVGQKPATANGGGITTPAGWTLQVIKEDAGGYGGTLGVDTGNVNLYGFTKIANGTESGALNVTLDDSNAAWAGIFRFSNNVEAPWDLGTAVGEQTLGGNVNVTLDSNPGIEEGDYVVAAMVIPTDDTSTGKFSAQGLSHTGATINVTAELDEHGTSIGNDIGGAVWGFRCTAGTGTGNPTLTATCAGTNTNVRGGVGLIRIRVV